MHNSTSLEDTILASLTGDVEMTILCIRSHPSHIEDAILASLTGDVQMTILCSHPSHTRSSHLQGKGKIFISQLFFFRPWILVWSQGSYLWPPAVKCFKSFLQSKVKLYVNKLAHWFSIFLLSGIYKGPASIIYI